ncbi:MAG: hypothetical protein WA945_06525, partial [Arcobacteraceae bacterium]
MTKTQISELYVSIFNRASEKSGSENWLNSGYNTDATAMANAMLDTDAAKEYFGASLDSDAAFVEHIYANTLNKAGADVDAAGKAGWVEFLETGSSRGEMVTLLIEAVKEYEVGGSKYDDADQATKDAAQQFANRVEVSDYTAETLDTIAVEDIDSTLSFDGALDVTADDATVAAAEAKVAAAANPEVEGSTYELTAGTDKGADFTGTDDNDTFDASLVQTEFTGAVANSLSTADKLDGGAGTDTLNAELVRQFSFNGDVSEVSPTTKDIEIVEFNAQDTTSIVNNAVVQNTITVDAEKMIGVDSIGSYYSDGDLVIENVNTLTNSGEMSDARNTEALTITMDHTDNMNSDGDASDLTVYFDEDYLLAGKTTSTSQANYWLLDQDATDYDTMPLENIERSGVTLTIDGVAYTIEMDADT